MGNICCTISEDSNFIQANFTELKTRLICEYKSYIKFLHKLKKDLNSTILEKKKDETNQNNNNDINIYNDSTKSNQNFYLIPRTWFDNWEKRVEAICKTNKYKPYNLKYEYKNEEKMQFFYYELVSSDIWAEFCRNKIYKLEHYNHKIRKGMICNNLIIIFYNKINAIEIFFFEKEEDLFFTNLLFSFEKSQENQRDCYEFLEILKKSPIQEILGVRNYDKSKEFFVDNSNMIIYNKTGEIGEEIKKFREYQYDLEFANSGYSRSLIDIEKQQNIYDNRKIDGYFNINKDNKRYYGGLFDLRIQNGESTVTGYNISSSSYLNMNNNKKNNNNNSSRNMTKSIKIMKINSQYDNTIPLKKNTLTFNKTTENEYRKNSRNFLLNPKADISTIFDGKSRYSNIFDCFEENKSNQSFFESILYCLYNIKELTNYFLNNKENYKKTNNSFYNEYLNIIKFLNEKKSNLNDKLDNNKTTNRNDINEKNNCEEKDKNNNLISSCPDYNYQNLLSLITFHNSINIISKILYTFHDELNTSSKKSIENNLPEKIKYQDENEKKKTYENFVKECKENNNSIIFEMFYGIKEKKLICNKCKKKLL